MRIGMVSTSRSGCTYVRRYVCNRYNLIDSGSWLKNNSYDDIELEEWIGWPHVLKVLIHYIPLQERKGVLCDFDRIWLWRGDTVRQFLSQITRLKTGVNHVYDDKDIPIIGDKTLVAEKSQFDKFMLRQKEFWDLYYELGFPKNDPLIRFEDFVENPKKVCKMLEDWFYMEFSCGPELNDQALPRKIDIDYSTKYVNYEEVLEWFGE